MKDSIAPHDITAQEPLAASVQPLTLPKGLYTFSVRSADPERVAELGGLMLPALHVGLGPSVPANSRCGRVINSSIYLVWLSRALAYQIWR